MIVKMIYEHAKLHVDGDFPWVHARRWINEAQRLIATMCESGSPTKLIEIKVDKPYSWYDLPKDFIKVNKVYLNGTPTNDFLEGSGKILLRERGTFQVEYKKIPKDITNESDTPELHELYHYPISYWVASREQFRFNPDNPDGQRLEATFYFEIANIDKMLKNKKRVRKIQT